MNEILGNNIMRLRKEAGMTQEQFAGELGISYQAVSKWENGISCPDISSLPVIADLFGISIDSLFGRETAAKAAPEEEKGGYVLPWPDDNTLYAALFKGHTYIGSGDAGSGAKKRIEFCYEGPALNVHSEFSVTCECDVEGSVTAEGSVNCNDIGGDVNAGGSVNCDSVEGDVTAGGSVTCDEVGGNVRAGGSVTCDDVSGGIRSEGSVTCDCVDGDVYANQVQCDEIAGGIFRME